MKREEVEHFKPPFEIITRNKRIYRVMAIVRLNHDSLYFEDKFGSRILIDLDEISVIEHVTYNLSKRESDDDKIIN